MKRNQVLLLIIFFFHLVGLIGIYTRFRTDVIALTPWNLLLTFTCFLLSFKRFTWKVVFAIFLVALAGFLAEWIGVQTGLLFGFYHYGSSLGIQVLGVPLLIGVNWILLTWSATAFTVRWKIPIVFKAIFSALFLTGFDWVMEPAAMKLGFWEWESGQIPLYNYVCWALLSFCFSIFLLKKKVVEPNQVVCGIGIILLIFFAILR